MNATDIERRSEDRGTQPGHPGTGQLAPGPVPEALIALGRALDRRSKDIAVSIADQWEKKQGYWGTPQEAELRAEIIRITELGTCAVARFLITHESPTPRQAAAVSEIGRAPVDERVTLAGLTKLYLYWRDAAVQAVNEEADKLGSSQAVTEEALAVVRAGTDSSLVGMAKQFDVAYVQLHSKLAEEQARLAYLALHDTLTGLPNRALFLEQLTRALSASDRRKSQIAVLFVDIDHFKSVNDLAGHSVGDQLLTTVATRLQQVIRPGDTAARLGGDEFVVLCEDLRAGEDEAAAVAQRIRSALAVPMLFNGRALVTSASIGVAVAQPDDDPDVLLSHADAAMYRVKQNGRDHHHIYQHTS
jgi:diguanylate cyclase (GGDEF)-like protein